MIMQHAVTSLPKSVCARCRGPEICARCRDLYQLAFRIFGIRKEYRDFSLVNNRHFLLSILNRLAYQFPSPSVGKRILSVSIRETSSSLRSFRVQWMILMLISAILYLHIPCQLQPRILCVLASFE
jgi:hypothetical protein